MDDEALLRLARVLPIIPPLLTESELENRMAAAAEREAATGASVATFDRELAAHFALHPDDAEDYAAIVVSLRAEATPQTLRGTRAPYQRWAPRSGLQRAASPELRRDSATYEHDWAALRLRTKLRLRVEDAASSLFLELTPLDDAELDFAQISVALMPGLSITADEMPAAPLELLPLGPRGTVLFTDLEPATYTLAITLPDAEQLMIDIPADLWPTA